MKLGTHYPTLAFGLGTVELCRRSKNYGHALHYCSEVRRLILRERRKLRQRRRR